MGLDYIVRFKEKISFKDESKKVFSPFSRGLSLFIGNHLNDSNSLLNKIESATSIKLEFITKLNLYDFKVDDFQLEFADKLERERLEKIQKKLNSEAHKAWYNIDEFIVQLDLAIELLNSSTGLREIEYDRKWWLNYLDNGDFVKDLKSLNELLKTAKEQNQVEFTYVIY